MIEIGWFSEMKTHSDNGSVKDFICTDPNYNKQEIIDYLSDESKRFAGCPRAAIDCMTGEKISDSFSAYRDDEYCWPDFLVYHIKKYNILLPDEFVEKIVNSNRIRV